MAAITKIVSNFTMPSKKYGKVVITLENVLISPEKLANSPSFQDGLDPETELDLRILGCELIQTSGILLKLPQVAMATGQVLFQRFYYAKSMVRYPMETTAMACVALASKIEEAPMKIRDVINVFHHIKQVKNGKNITPVILDSNYIALKNQIVKAERRLLKELGFCCHVKHPHKIIIMYLRLLEAEQQKLAQSSWNYMNDALRTDVFVRYSPETIACACIWLAGRQLKIPLPENPPWYRIFRVTLYDIEEIAASVLKLYTRKKVKLEALEAKVEEIRREQQEARLRNKAVSTLATPKEVTSFSPASRSNTPSKAAHTTAAALSPPRKRSSSDRGKASVSSGDSRSKSRSPRPSRKKTKRSHTKSRSRSRSHTRSRSPPSRDRHHHTKRKYVHVPSRSPSPAVTPPPRFIKNKEKGPIVRSMSRSRSRSRTPHRGYDKYDLAHHRSSSKGLLLLQSSFEKEAKSEKESKDRSSSEGSKLPRYDKVGGESGGKDKYPTKYLEKAERKRLLRESKKYYDNGYDTSKYHPHHHHKSASKKGVRQRSRSRDRDNRRR